MNRKLVWAVSILSMLILSGAFVMRAPSTAAQIGPKIILYWEENFEGRSLELTGTTVDLPIVSDAFGNEFDWNDEVRSIVVVGGTWRVFQNGRLGTRLDATPLEVLDVRAKPKAAGWSCLLSATSRGPLEIPNAAVGDFFHDISSVELVSEQNLPDWAAPSRVR